MRARFSKNESEWSVLKSQTGQLLNLYFKIMSLLSCDCWSLNKLWAGNSNYSNFQNHNRAIRKFFKIEKQNTNVFKMTNVLDQATYALWSADWIHLYKHWMHNFSMSNPYNPPTYFHRLSRLGIWECKNNYSRVGATTSNYYQYTIKYSNLFHQTNLIRIEFCLTFN